MSIVKVKNRSTGPAIYSIPELGDKRNIRREFAPGETKDISTEEIEALTFVPGGTNLLTNYLQILDENVIESVLHSAEPEYKMSEEDIKKLMREGSLDAFLDCLDFAPIGVIELIKEYAVSLPLNDSEKREALFKKTGFDTTAALNLKRKAEEEEEAAKEDPRERRVQVNTGRRTSPEYKIVQK